MIYFKQKSKKYFCIILALILSLYTASLVSASESVNSQTLRIDKFIDKQMKDNKIPGLSIGVVNGDDVIYLKGYGKADSSGRAVTPQTPFLLGSVSKSFTALAIMQLRDKGKVQLDEPIDKYLQWFKATYKGRPQKITVRQLLSHNSGIGNLYDGTEDSHKTVSQVAKERLNNIRLKALPGTECSYSNANYLLAGEIIQEVTGESYQDYIKTNIFIPLEMKHSYVSKEDAQKDNLASGYRKWFGLPIEENVPYFLYSLPFGHIISCSEDMTHYLIALMNEGRYKNTTILSSDGIKELFTPQADEKFIPAGIEGTKNYYAFGWRVIYNNDKISMYQHSGETANYHSNIIINPNSHLGVIQIDNFGGDPSFIRPGLGVMDLFMGKEPIESNYLKTVFTIMRIAAVILLVLLLIPILRLRSWKKRIAKSKGRRILNISIMLIINFILPLVILFCLYATDWNATMNVFPDISWTAIITAIFLLLTGILKTYLTFSLWLQR